MEFTAKYDFYEEYIPPRCRKPRSRLVEKTMAVTISEVTDSEAPVALITTTWETRKGEFGLTETLYRWYGKKLYTPCISHSGEEYTIHDVAHRINETRFPAVSEQERRAKVRQNAKRYLIIDGVLHEQSGEPMYTYTTFGLGRNHGGTGFFIETCYNTNKNYRNYFNAFQREEAIKCFKSAALGRGDTESVKSEPEINIEVLLPEAVRRKPKRHERIGRFYDEK